VLHPPGQRHAAACHRGPPPPTLGGRRPLANVTGGGKVGRLWSRESAIDMMIINIAVPYARANLAQSHRANVP